MKYFISLSVILLGVFSCSKDKEDKAESTINMFSVSQDVSKVQFNYEVVGDFSAYAISYDLASAEAAGGEGSMLSTDSQEEYSKPVSELSLQFGNKYAFYIKGTYDGTKETEWYGPEYLDLGFLCETPYDLDITGSQVKTLTWSVDNHSVKANKFQIRYVEQGLDMSLGKTIEVVNALETSDFQIEKNVTYDVYVRGFCGGAYQWSDWSDPMTFHATESSNACIEPNIIILKQQPSVLGGNEQDDIRIKWTDPGNNSRYELGFIESGNPLTSDDITYLESIGMVYLGGGFVPGESYDFYVRVICLDGSKTEWAMETLIYN